MSDLDDIKATFFEECSELMEQLQAGLMVLEAGEQDADTVDAVFRAVHSIKGGAGAFGLSELVAFAHEFETALDGIRTDRLDPTPDVLATMLRASDRLGDLVEFARTGHSDGQPMPQDLLDLVASISSGGGAESSVEDDFGLDLSLSPDVDFAPIPIDITGEAPPAPEPAEPEDFEIFDMSDDPGDSEEDEDEVRAWQIRFEPTAELLESGNEPLFLFRALQVMGAITPAVDESNLPDLEALDTSVASLTWVLTMVPSAQDLTSTEIESVFDFTEDLCNLEITATTVSTASLAPVAPPDPEKDAPEEPAIASVDLAPEVSSAPTDVPSTGDQIEAAKAPANPPAEGKAVAAPQPAMPAKADASDKPAPAAPAKKATLSATIRVDLDRIDRLVNLVGELVISQSMLAQNVLKDGLDNNSDSASSLDDLQQLTRDIQDSVMAIRAQPVRSLFQRMSRIVREAAQMTDKQVRMETTGEATEIDKTVVERLADPLTHMIRNAIDHGLEPKEERIAAGKDPVGIVGLTARQRSDRVVIEVSDDGRGINRERVLARAIERGLVPADRTLEPSEIDRLLFMPGFSTAEGVSSLSGRGVGMDVVQRAIRDLNGTIAVSSESGKGCTISISLPLTLAILDGMIVRTNEQRMVIPLSAIIETQTVSASRIEMLGRGQTVVQLHDKFVPVVDLAAGMGFDVPSKHVERDPESDAALLFVQPDDHGPFALQVDEIEAQRQVVIKGLGSSFGRVPCVSAATILGDGQVALIVDPGGLAMTAGLTNADPYNQQEARVQ